MPVAAGRMSPSAPRNSATPMKRSVPTETSSTHGNLGASLSLGCDIFISPAMRNAAARTPCSTHSTTFTYALLLTAYSDVQINRRYASAIPVAQNSSTE